MSRRLLLLFLTLLLAVGAPQAAPARAETAVPPENAFHYFPETGHMIGMQVKRFYDANGGLEAFGMALTEVFTEDGQKVQYFERARFEIRNDPNFRVELTRLGSYYSQGRGEPAFQWLGEPPADLGDRTYYPESGHTLGGAFRWYWQTKGGLTSFGYPVSEELSETTADGQTLLVQYFERARFEYHPDLVGQPGEVQLSSLGRQFLSERPAAQAQTAPVKPITLLGKATTSFRTSAAEREFNIARATAMFNGMVVPAGQEFSFLGAGDFSDTAGFVEGYGIVGGRLEKVIGGGLCQVSTTMFRAVSNAGLQITRRQGHSYVVYFYENILGFDATVFSPSLDFRWRNDSPGPVYIAATSNPADFTVTFQIWGTSDGRVTSYQGPFVKNVVRPGRATWQYNSSLAAGRVSQLVHGRSGMDVNYIRTVKMPNGTVKHYDNYFTHYDPWNDFYTYGPGVKPPAGANVIR